MGMGMEMGVKKEVGDGWMGPRSKLQQKDACLCMIGTVCACVSHCVSVWVREYEQRVSVWMDGPRRKIAENVKPTSAKI